MGFPPSESPASLESCITSAQPAASNAAELVLGDPRDAGLAWGQIDGRGPRARRMGCSRRIATEAALRPPLDHPIRSLFLETTYYALLPLASGRGRNSGVMRSQAPKMGPQWGRRYPPRRGHCGMRSCRPQGLPEGRPQAALEYDEKCPATYGWKLMTSMRTLTPHTGQI